MARSRKLAPQRAILGGRSRSGRIGPVARPTRKGFRESITARSVFAFPGKMKMTLSCDTGSRFHFTDWRFLLRRSVFRRRSVASLWQKTSYRVILDSRILARWGWRTAEARGWAPRWKAIAGTG